MTSHWCVFNCTMLFYVMLCSMYPMYVPYMVHNVTNISYSMSPIWCSMYPMYLILCPLYGTQCTHCNVPILCPLFWDQIGLLSYVDSLTNPAQKFPSKRKRLVSSCSCVQGGGFSNLANINLGLLQ